jgi:putative nucleotidyltransferase with HDIG domain
LPKLTEWAYPLAESLLAEPLPRRWKHCLGVAERARTLTLVLDQDADLLEAAAVLHDIGYAPDLAKTGFHPLDGARYLRDVADADERIINLVAHHSCSWMEADARGLREELESDMTPPPAGTPTNPLDRINEITERYGPRSLIGKFIRRAEPEILACTSRVLERVAAAKRQPM